MSRTGRRRGKNKITKNKRGSVAGPSRKKSNQLGLGVESSRAGPGGLAMSKSENNLFEKCNGGQRLFCGYDGVVTSMRDLQFETEGTESSARAMNDLSRNQVLNTIQMSQDEVGDQEENKQLVCEFKWSVEVPSSLYALASREKNYGFA